ncbi:MULTISPECIES: class I SAM-dependent methyltransferase [Thermoactinomyces]|jgi:ubiquinone/menaquinone biosynthesis C-methylase UbiE|uniref:Class I SAM-dependent methyltransferase n=1 Tax=Thermoactinomyces daqus TaxID=1329516 RepID=A0A7W1XCJ8_9BACL|nr:MULTISPECIES: class I SAM-dependent methyltransferase [Thermoactinomyces]MBA4544191.1 class I SAM-dependent methyltransferase [Thermoactinomyces daqus]MBH8597952.1 class I SAM-dependent methyltransferase [Thermoactinomyces sp. CICC 10523]MBH8604306.1 class I SAM-dependent methyltransferase [Thermoactinomyces sp. CICC 10522]
MSENPTKGPEMSGFIATWYAKNTEKQIEKYRNDAKKVFSSVSEGDAVLELAPGPGYLSIELAKMGRFHITGLDISKKFVQMAQANATRAGVDIDFRHGDAAQMPFDDHAFDFIICRAAFKNFSKPVAALDEMNRVLKPGGKALIIDFKKDVSKDKLDQFVSGDLGFTGINSLVTKWMFRFVVIKQAYTKDEVKEMIAKSKFQTGRIHEGLIGLEVWLEKK